MYGTFAQRMECYNYPSLLFLILTYILLRHNYLIYFFDVVTFFYDVRITLYFGTFELCMEIMLQLRFAFVRHCEVTFITSRLQFLLRHIYVIYLFDAVTFFDDVRITL